MNLLRLILILIMVLLFGYHFGSAQEPPSAQEALAAKEIECRHTSMLDMQEKARFRGGPHMKITVYTGKHLEYIFQDRLRTEHRALYIEKVSIIPVEFAKKYDNEKWWILYCDEHKVVHQIVKYLPPDKR